ncbi:hypothetical protein NXV57_15955 [Bacteroides thetaiotaomicron]|nr:hypothetical protein [Bacteroides thetaiotaomicron]
MKFEGAQVLYKSAVNHTTRGNIGATATIDIDKGVLAATIAGDMNKATTTADELDMLALQLTTTAGNTFTTGYFAVYNKKKTFHSHWLIRMHLLEKIRI